MISGAWPIVLRLRHNVLETGLYRFRFPFVESHKTVAKAVTLKSKLMTRDAYDALVVFS